MKRLIIALGVSFTLSLTSCIGEGKTDGPDSDMDSTLVEQADSIHQVTGIAVDGAMNSVYLKVGDDTIEFSYPNIDSEHRAAWDVGDTITVRFYVTQDGDSVTEVLNEGISS